MVFQILVFVPSLPVTVYSSGSSGSCSLHSCPVCIAAFNRSISITQYWNFCLWLLLGLVFSLTLLFCNFTMMCLCVVFFVFILIEVHSFLNYGLMTSVNFGKFPVISSSEIFFCFLLSSGTRISIHMSMW